MENLIWYFGIGLLLYVIVNWLTSSPKITIDKEINDILTKEEYKVKGRF